MPGNGINNTLKVILINQTGGEPFVLRPEMIIYYYLVLISF